MGTYRNPDPDIVVTGAEIYEGINTLASDVLKIANDERTRKAEIIGQSLADQQAVDDNINKLGLNTGEGASPLEKQLLDDAMRTKQAIAYQYELMSQTFASQEQIARSKTEISRLSKYPEQVASDLSTGQYLVDEYSKALQNAPGSKDAISFTNDADMLQVVQDMKAGGKNTRVETNKAGSRILVTTIDGKESKLNISNITNGLKTNPNTVLFKTVVDDQDTTDLTKTAILGPGGGKDASKAELIAAGVLEKGDYTNIEGKNVVTYTLNEEKAKKATKGILNNLIKNPQNYDYLNSIWQDKMGKSGNVGDALAEKGNNVEEQVENYYFNKAKESLGKDMGITFEVPGQQKPKLSAVQNQLVQLAKGYGKSEKQEDGSVKRVRGTGITSVQYGDVTYKIVGKKLENQRVVAYKSVVGDTSKKGVDDLGVGALEFVEIEGQDFPLYIKGPGGKLRLNQEAWSAATYKNK